MTGAMVNAENSVSYRDAPMQTMKEQASRDNSVASLQEDSVPEVASHGRRSQEIRQMQREPLCLRKGEAARHPFDVKN